MAADPIDLTTLEAVKAFLGITSTGSDDLIQSIITRMSQWASSYCNRIFQETEWTEYHDGKNNNGGQVFLKQWPVISVTSLHDSIDRQWDAASLIDADTYVFEAGSGIIKRLLGTDFCTGVQNIQVVYTAGYAEGQIPTDLEQAVIDMVALKFNGRGKEDLRSEKLGRWGVVYFNHPTLGRIQMTQAVIDVLNRYRKQTFVVV